MGRTALGPGARRARVRPARALAALAVAAAIIPATALAGTLDQEQPATIGLLNGLTGTTSTAQVFTAGITGRLDQVEVLVRKFGTTADMTIEIQSVEGGTPTGTVLASATVPNASVPGLAGTWMPVAIDAPSVAGTQYALVVHGPGPTGGRHLWQFGSLVDAYAGGARHMSADGTAWGAPSSGDQAFRTYVEADATAPALTLPEGPTAPAAGPEGAVVTFPATASDDLDGEVEVTCTPASGSAFPVGTTDVTCTAVDTAGNEATGTFTVTVTPPLPPFPAPPEGEGDGRGETPPPPAGPQASPPPATPPEVPGGCPAGDEPFLPTLGPWDAPPAGLSSPCYRLVDSGPKNAVGKDGWLLVDVRYRQP